MSFDSLRRARNQAALVALALVPAFTGTALAQGPIEAAAGDITPIEAPAGELSPLQSPDGLDLPGNVLFTGDYETGDTSQWAGCQRSGSWSAAVQTGNVRQGRYAARYEVRDGDNPIGYGERAECQVNTRESEGQERFYSWSTYFDADFPVANSIDGWAVFTQWHSTVDGSPPMGFYLENGKMVLKMHRRSSASSFIGNVSPWGMDFASNRGRWIDFKVRVKWSGSDSVGFVELWVDGVRQKMNWPNGGNAAAYGGLNSETVNVRTLVPGYNNYAKQGYYRAVGLSDTAVIYFDGFRMTDATGVTPPPPAAVITVGVAPTSATVAAGAEQQFTASVANSTAGVVWSVNGVAGGNAQVGTISPSGRYTAPSVSPSTAITVAATSVENSAVRASAAVSVTAPAPPPPPSVGMLFREDFDGVTPGSAGSPWTALRDGENAFTVQPNLGTAGSRAGEFTYTGVGNYTYLTRSMGEQAKATITTRVLVSENTLANNHSRTLIRVVDGPGNRSGARYQAGLHRDRNGNLHWAVWGAGAGGTYTYATLSKIAPKVGQWYTLRLRTDWNSSAGRAQLAVEGAETITSPSIPTLGAFGDRVEVGTPWSRTGDRLKIVFDDVTATPLGTTTSSTSRRSARRTAGPVVGGPRHR